MTRPAEICRMFDAWKAQRSNFDNTHQEIVDNIDPHQCDVITERAPGEKKNQLVFDGTAGYAADVFSDFYVGSVCNQGTKWHSVTHGDPKIAAKPEAAEWYNYARDRALKLTKNMYGPIGQAIGAWSLFGNGPVLVEEVPNRKPYQSVNRYTSVPWGQWVAAEGDDGKIDKFVRELKLPAHRAVKIGDVSDDIKRAAEKEPLKEFKILHSILPRDFQDYKPKKSAIETNKDYPWASCWIEYDKKRLLKESGYRKFPVAVSRYRLISGEVYARGLGERALADAKTSNKMRELMLLWGGRQLDPPMLVRRNSIINGILNIQAKGKTVVTDINNSVKSLIENSDLPGFEHLQEEVHRQLLRYFHVDEILNLLSHESPQLTAFEVNARLTLLQQILGPVFGQNDVEFFNVLLDVTYDNLFHMVDAKGKPLIAPPPDIVAESLEDGLNFVYEGPLARAQRNQELINIQQSVADTQGIVAFDPEEIYRVKWGELHRRVYEIRGTNEFMASDEEFKEIVDQARAKKNAETAAALVGGGAEALGKVAPFVKATRESVGGAAAA